MLTYKSILHILIMSFSHLRRRALCCHSVPCLRIQSRLRRLISTPSNVNHIRSSPSSVTSRLKTINNSKTSLDRSEEPVPESTETTQTDYNKLDIFSNTPPPSTAIDACLHNGFVLNNGQKISDGSGVLLIGGEGFLWRPWRMNASVAVSANDEKSGKCSKYNMNSKGQFEIAKEALGLLKAMWPKPGKSKQQ